jgi:outer membrane protein, multidrug efflux system
MHFNLKIIKPLVYKVINKQLVYARMLSSFFLILSFTGISFYTSAQNTADTSKSFTIDQCIDYALHHQPALNQSLINESIAQATNSINLSAWLPQVNLTGSLTHYIQQPTTLVDSSGTVHQERTGIANTAIPGIGITQAIFTPQLSYAAKSAKLYVKQAQQITDSTKINIVSSVSQSFYNLLLTFEQIDILKEDTARLTKNYNDTYHQYVGGIVDQTDYEEAAITLNNSKAQLKQTTENLLPQYATLKQLMGFPQEQQFNISFDTAQMMQNISFDTTQQLQYEKRIEFQQLQTTKGLQHNLVDYYKSAWLPSISAFYNYNYEYENNNFSKLFDNAYPNSLIGLDVTMPLFTGFWRVESLRRARLQEKVLDWSEVDLRSQIYTEYSTAMANYKGNLYNFNELRENVVMAKDVYRIVSLQYHQGTVAYLNVITAESNLITSEINYLNALFQVLSSKIALEKALGDISY